MSDVDSNFATPLWLLQNLENFSKSTTMQDIFDPCAMHIC